jgi:hypothetical protein
LPKRRTPHLPRKLKPTDASVRAKGPSYVQYDRDAANLATQNKVRIGQPWTWSDVLSFFAITKPLVYL